MHEWCGQGTDLLASQTVRFGPLLAGWFGRLPRFVTVEALHNQPPQTPAQAAPITPPSPTPTHSSATNNYP